MGMILGKHRAHRPRFNRYITCILLNVSDISRYVVASVGFGKTDTVCAVIHTHWFIVHW